MDENEVYFYHSMRYPAAQFALLCAEVGLESRTLTLSERGRPVPYVEFGEADNVVVQSMLIELAYAWRKQPEISSENKPNAAVR